MWATSWRRAGIDALVPAPFSQRPVAPLCFLHCTVDATLRPTPDCGDNGADLLLSVEAGTPGGSRQSAPDLGQARTCATVEGISRLLFVLRLHGFLLLCPAGHPCATALHAGGQG